MLSTVPETSVVMIHATLKGIRTHSLFKTTQPIFRLMGGSSRTFRGRNCRSGAGPGVAHPELLFRPFQEVADVTGLGLYVTRALLRGFAGELRYEGVPASTAGACFTVELALSPGVVQVMKSVATRAIRDLVDDHALFRRVWPASWKPKQTSSFPRSTAV